MVTILHFILRMFIVLDIWLATCRHSAAYSFMCLQMLTASPKALRDMVRGYSLLRTPESPTCSTFGVSLLQIIKVMYVKCWLYLLCRMWFRARIMEEKFFCLSLCLCGFITRYCQYFVGCIYCTFSACKTEDSEAFGIGAWYPA